MPFTVDNNTVHGPGVYEMKGGITQIIFALEALAQSGIKPAVTPIVFLNADEEIGSRESTHHVRRLARSCCRAFVLEPSLGRDGKLKTTRKGVGRFTVKIAGKAAHAGLDPEAGASAILELSHVVQSLFALNDTERGITVNVGTIEGGVRSNVIAATSGAVVDVRVRTQEDADQVSTATLDGLGPVGDGAHAAHEFLYIEETLQRTALPALLMISPEDSCEVLSGRMCQVFDGDLMVGALGTRAATLEGVGDWRAIGDDGELHALTPAGLFGKATSVSPLLPPLMRLRYRGHAVRDSKLSMCDYCYKGDVTRFDMPVVLIN